jgi:energy-coupling factor transport system ATP-binding protein
VLVARGLVVAPAGRAAGERVACGPLDLDVAAGGWLTIRGGNGAGKSTLLATLAGLVSPVAGTVRIAGHDPFSAAGRRGARAAVGIVFQEPETQGLTDAVGREIAFPLENLGWPRAAIEARVEELIAGFDLDSVRAAPPSHLSGGEAQRVALAAAMAARPDLLLLDEPASYLDPAGRAALWAALAGLRERERTTIVWSVCDGDGVGPPEGSHLDLGPGLPLGIAAGVAPAAPPPAFIPETGDEPLWRADGLRLVRRDERGTVELWGGIHFAIGRGERVVVRGANGAGKTALLDALAGQREAGRAGTLTGQGPGTCGGLGYLTQFPESQLFAETVFDDVAFALRHRSGGRSGRPDGAAIAARTAAALTQVGLDPALVGERSPDSLSLGERRRVALAGILVGEPGAVLLDEPTAGLDEPGRRDLEAALERAAGREITLVVASHDPAWAGRPGWRTLTLPDPIRGPAGGPAGAATRP